MPVIKKKGRKDRINEVFLKNIFYKLLCRYINKVVVSMSTKKKLHSTLTLNLTKRNFS